VKKFLENHTNSIDIVMEKKKLWCKFVWKSRNYL